MPGDSKRFTGPTNTTDYHAYVSTSLDNHIISGITSNSRDDGRTLEAHRPISIRTGIISQAKGSAYIEMNRTKVVCSVFGPREVSNRSDYSIYGELYCEFKFAPFSCKNRRSFIRDSDEREYSVNLQRALEPAVIRTQFPNLQVDVYTLVLENDGSTLAASITCASLALANASIPMYDLVTAVSMGLYDGRNIIDLSYAEEVVCNNIDYEDSDELRQKNQGVITVSYAVTLQQVTEIVHHGVVSGEVLSKCIKRATEENNKLYSISRQCLVREVLSTLKPKKTDLYETNNDRKQ